MEKVYSEETYVICHNGKDVIHPAKVAAGTNLATGQPTVEEFQDEASWKARLTELGFDITKLDPPAPGKFGGGAPGALKGEGPGARGPLLSAEERKDLSPEQRRALREERRGLRQAARKGVAPSETPAPAPTPDPAPAPETPAQS